VYNQVCIYAAGPHCTGILQECCNLMNIREKYFTCSSLKELFENFDAATIMALFLLVKHSFI